MFSKTPKQIVFLKKTLMKRHSLLIIAFLCFFISACKVEPTIEELTTNILQLNRGMERAYNNDEIKKIVNFYAEDAFILGSNNSNFQGRVAIEESWTNIKNPIRWKIDVIKVAKTEAELYETEYWENLKNKPTHWKAFNVPFKAEDELLYQLGHSTLEYDREDDTHHTREVDFIFVWKKNEQGFYRIYVDTYN